MKSLENDVQIAHIDVLDQKGYLTSTKFMKPLSELPSIGSKVLSFYDDEYVLYNAAIEFSYEEKTIRLLNGSESVESMFIHLIKELSVLVNMIANSTMEDLTLSGYNDFSTVRELEAAVNAAYLVVNKDDVCEFTKQSYTEQEVKDILNSINLKLSMLRCFYSSGFAFGLIQKETTLDKRSSDFIRFFSSAMNVIVANYRMEEKTEEYEKALSLENEEEYRLELEDEYCDFVSSLSTNKISILLSIIGLSYSKIKKDTDYFKEKI